MGGLPGAVNEYSPTQANLSAIVLSGGPKDNSFAGVGPVPANQILGSSNLAGSDQPSEILGAVDNNNILPLSLNDSSRNSRNHIVGADGSRPLSGGSQQTSTQKLKKEMYLQE